LYGIFTYIYHKDKPNVGKYASPMDAMGKGSWWLINHTNGFLGHIFLHPKMAVFKRRHLFQKKYKWPIVNINERKHSGALH